MVTLRRRGNEIQDTAAPEIGTDSNTTITVSNTTIIPRAMILGVVPNIYLLYTIHQFPFTAITLCARIFIAVNTFRCVFPNRYNANIVLHDNILSSIFITRFLATLSEVSWIYLLSVVAKDLNAEMDSCPGIDALVNLLPPLCIAAQCFVWASLILQTDSLMFWEESIWAIMFVINTGVNAVFRYNGNHSHLVTISIVFGIFYLPWQILGHLRYILDLEDPALKLSNIRLHNIVAGTKRALFYRKQSDKDEDWGGWIGGSWMFMYWVVMPWWLAGVVMLYSSEGRM